MKPYIEERLNPMAVDPDSAWDDSDLAKLVAYESRFLEAMPHQLLQENPDLTLSG